MDSVDAIPEFCREIEAYLCRKNDGHLIRVVGPSFELVSGWARQGIPIKVAFAGIDRYFERYYRSGPRRRPVKIDFCEADVLDVFDEWRRATGITQSSGSSRESSLPGSQSQPSRQSLPEHLERVVMRLSSARASGKIDERFDAIIDRVSAALDDARAKPGGLRGEARSQLLEQLSVLDHEMLGLARDRIDAAMLSRLAADAATELAPFKGGMDPDAYSRAHEAAVNHSLRNQLGLPAITFD